MTDIERREFPLRDLEVRELEGGGMSVAGIVAPYGEVADLGYVSERFERGAFHYEPEVPLRDEHRATIGASQSFEERADGLWGEFRISDTAAGRDAHTLARDRAYRSFSVGFVPEESRTEGDVVVRTRARLVEVSLVGVPAYSGAAVQQVRSANEEVNPMTDQTTEHGGDVETRAEELAANEELVVEMRALAAEMREARAPAPTDSPRVHQHRNLGEIVVDAAAAYSGDVEARSRIDGYLEHRQMVATPKGYALELRAFSTPGASTGDGAGVVPPGYIPDLLEVVRQGMRSLAGFGTRELPPTTKVELPKITTTSLVDYQTAEGGAVASQNVVTETDEFEVVTLAGGQGVTMQARRLTNPGYFETVVNDLLADYASKANFESINGDGTGTGPVANMNGILNVAPTTAAATDDVAGLVAALGAAAAAVYGSSDNDGTGRWPTAVIMTPARWGYLIGQTDTDGRPLVNQEAPQNPVGIGDASAVGTLRGLPVIVDYDIPTNLGVGTNEDALIVTNWRDALYFEDSPAPVTLMLTYPDVLVTDVSVAGLSSLAIRRPAAFNVITGLTAP